MRTASSTPTYHEESLVARPPGCNRFPTTTSSLEVSAKPSARLGTPCPRYSHARLRVRPLRFWPRDPTARAGNPPDNAWQVLLYPALPHNHHPPAHPSELSDHPGVTQPVPPQLLRPEIASRPRGLEVQRTPVPEVAMHKHHHSRRRKYNVRSAREPWVDSVRHSCDPERCPQEPFRARVSRPDP
jgi:hypothetical protein